MKNRKGSCKINRICPARMLVNERHDGTVKVKYIHTHTHSISLKDTRHLRIPNSIRSQIALKLSLGVPSERILQEFYEDASDLEHRDVAMKKRQHFVTAKHINSVKRRLFDLKTNKASDDATSVFLKIKSLQSNPSTNPILFFKMQHSKEFSEKGLNPKDFLLVFMTNKQKEMFQKFGERILCMDSTHGTNSYLFKLITLLVVDEYKRGYPVAFCVTNREDETTIKIFIESVHRRCPETVISYLMSDDDIAGFNAVRSVYGNNVKHYLCIWHVMNSWFRNVKKYCTMMNRNDIEKDLKNLLHSKTNTITKYLVQIL
ncbi:uncharacterized protein LOC128551562 [Mercenaria mercenaria]|uniref:uncharacterized protein LOC128551562 n=1 Tax=Mercenaria mercenaria TaxID=6596 RepID=UPI00234E902C|nr:uncharacterized protein LOC128551562 [Mercenaria mercenaria]